MKKIYIICLLFILTILIVACNNTTHTSTDTTQTTTINTESTDCTTDNTPIGSKPTSIHTVEISINNSFLKVSEFDNCGFVDGIYFDGYGILQTDISYALNDEAKKPGIYLLSSDDVVKIVVDNEEITTVRLYDNIGRPLVNGDTFDISNINNLPQNIYYIKILATSKGTGIYSNEYITMEYIVGFSTSVLK